MSDLTATLQTLAHRGRALEAKYRNEAAAHLAQAGEAAGHAGAGPDVIRKTNEYHTSLAADATALADAYAAGATAAERGRVHAHPALMADPEWNRHITPVFSQALSLGLVDSA